MAAEVSRKTCLFLLLPALQHCWLWLLMTLNPSTLLARFASLCDENNVAPVCHWPLWRHERFGQHHLFLSCSDPPLHIVSLCCCSCCFSPSPWKGCQKEMASILLGCVFDPLYSCYSRTGLFSVSIRDKPQIKPLAYVNGDLFRYRYLQICIPITLTVLKQMNYLLLLCHFDKNNNSHVALSLLREHAGSKST